MTSKDILGIVLLILIGIPVVICMWALVFILLKELWEAR